MAVSKTNTVSKAKKKNLAEVMGRINKKFGDNSISALKDVEDDLRVTFHKTPSHEVNAMLGGGFCRGKIVELYGQNSSGREIA